MPDILWQALGAFVRERRQELGLTQRELAEKADVWVNKVSVLERGNAVGEVNMQKILMALGEDPESPALWARIFGVPAERASVTATPGYANRPLVMAPPSPLAA